MISFEFTPEQEAFRSELRRFAVQELAPRYAERRQREAFGRPIAAFQGVSFPWAEHATEVAAARWLRYRALWARSVGEPHTDLAATAEWWPPKVAKEAIATTMMGSCAAL